MTTLFFSLTRFLYIVFQRGLLIVTLFLISSCTVMDKQDIGEKEIIASPPPQGTPGLDQAIDGQIDVTHTRDVSY